MNRQIIFLVFMGYSFSLSDCAIPNSTSCMNNKVKLTVKNTISFFEKSSNFNMKKSKGLSSIAFGGFSGIMKGAKFFVKKVKVQPECQINGNTALW